MTAAKTYSRHCLHCNVEMPHVSPHSRPARVALRTWQITIFLCSFGMLYPHTFSTDDAFAVKCTKCGTRGMLSFG